MSAVKIALSVETITLLLKTMALSAETIISLATFFYSNGSFRVGKHRYLQNAIAQVHTLLTVLVRHGVNRATI
ncbi:hypothetical protein [Nostoc sp. UHCC 0251]|uniref:hypothetical protein n=1 Tax=Nostoc sp. UHCC 0251 TaxID=3110240 RepID=UPI002B21D4D5|nr:hypothetical protein [Nostoc sp. UHCC 0251]MEA5627751.1 hypothetical protein [Nostoc sp. UHCC 0251]